MRFWSRDLRNARIARRSSRGSRYVDYIVLTGGSSARRCTKASTTLAHISPCFHLPTHSLPLSLPLYEYSLRSLIFLYTVPPMLSSLFVRLRSVFLCCAFTYYLPAKCTFHSQDPLSTLPLLFSLSSFSPVSSRFTETSVPPANKINASVSCIFAFDENVETLTRPVGSSGSVNFSILPSLSLMRSSTEANGSAWKDFQNNGARVAWHHSQHHLWSSFWQDKAFCICTHTFHEFHRNHRTERFFVQNSSKVDRPWLQKVIRQFPL